MKTATKLTLILLLLVAFALSVSLSPTSAAPNAGPASQLGVPTLYDSGWQLSTTGFHTFEHDLCAYPTLWTVLVADDANGLYPTEAITRIGADSDRYGYVVTSLDMRDLQIIWEWHGIGYSAPAGKWYQRGTDYVRLTIYAADTLLGYGGPPCRP